MSTTTVTYRSGCGHIECQGLSACIAPKFYPGVATVAHVFHRHVWAYRGRTPEGCAVMVCDDHDPPEVRIVVTSSLP